MIRPMRMIQSLAAMMLLTASSVLAEGAIAPLWQVNMEGSKLEFAILQDRSPIHGEFIDFDAEIRFDPDALEQSRIKIKIMMDSVSSGYAERDAMIRDRDLFDTETWPHATFVSSEILYQGEDNYAAMGLLTIRDISLETALYFRLQIENPDNDPKRYRALAEGELEMRRLNFGVGQGEWRDTSIIGDEVEVTFVLDAHREE